MLIDLIKTIKNDDTIWVMENRENSDKIFNKYVTDKLFSSTYVIVSKDIAYVFVHKLDEGNIELLDKKYCKVYIYSDLLTLNNYILEALRELNFPKNILLGYTTMSDENTDIITHSAYLRITKLFRKIYRENERKVKVKSAEMNIYEIISKNTKEDIEKLKILANITNNTIFIISIFFLLFSSKLFKITCLLFSLLKKLPFLLSFKILLSSLFFFNFSSLFFLSDFFEILFIFLPHTVTINS